MSSYGNYLDMIARVERELMLAEFEHRRRQGLLEVEQGPGLRGWLAARLVRLALRLDGQAGARAVEQLVARHA